VNASVDAGSSVVDVLLIDADEQRCLFVQRAIQSTGVVRCARKSSGREALDSYQRARFDAIVCRPHLGDIPYRNWIRMVRSGRFGYADTPALLLCDEVEIEELGPMVDEHTRLIPEDEADALTRALHAISNGADKPLVLIVEDERDSAEAAGKALEKVYRIELAHDGATALRLWRERRHALVLLDLMLPDIPGTEVLAEMLGENPNQAIIVLTAHSAPEKHKDVVLAGASDFLPKPLDMHALPEVCAAALRANKCMSNVERSRVDAAQMAELAARVRVAHYLIERGQTARGSAQLRRALVTAGTHPLDEDQWANLMSEFDAP
jgi:DNA-binding response OmpR family regulator